MVVIDELEAYASALTHKTMWKRFYELVKMDGDIGIWHETFTVREGEYEAIYGNMPRFGLAVAGEHRGLGSKSGARERLGAAG